MIRLSFTIQEELIIKMSIGEKFKKIDNKIDQNKAGYNLDRPTSKISVLSSENVSKYEFLPVKDDLAEKQPLEKAVALKGFEYSLLGKELKALADIAKKQYQKLDDIFMVKQIQHITLIIVFTNIIRI